MTPAGNHAVAAGRVRGSDITQALREAQQLQQDGQIDDAIDICEELFDSGVDRADVRYFLGWLYQEADRWQDAAAQFELLLDDPEYALSCFYALGQCERAQGNMRAAAQYFDEAVDRVNLDALTPDETDQLLQLCQEAAEAHRDMNDMEGAETIYQALLGFLRSQGWQDQVGEVERMMRETLGAAAPPPARRRRRNASRSNIPQRSGNTGRSLSNGPRPGVMSGGPMVGMGFDALVGGPGYAGAASNGAPSEQRGDHLAQLISNLSGGTAQMRASLMTLPEPVRAQVAQSVREIENYVAHGLLTAAIEECMLVMEIAPQYLDVHLLLGEIYVRQGKIEQAIAKYTVLVDTLSRQRAHRRRHRHLPAHPPARAEQPHLSHQAHRAAQPPGTQRGGADRAHGRRRRLPAHGLCRPRHRRVRAGAARLRPNNQVRLSYATALMKAGRARAGHRRVPARPADRAGQRARAGADADRRRLRRGSLAGHQPAWRGGYGVHARRGAGVADARAARAAWRALRQLPRRRARLHPGAGHQSHERRSALRPRRDSSRRRAAAGGADRASSRSPRSPEWRCWGASPLARR